MLKREKRKKIKEKILKKTDEQPFVEKNIELQKNNLPEQIKKLSESLYYMSETDAEILPFVGKHAASVSREAVLSQTESPDDSPVEERDFTGFFKRLTEIQDWFGEEEKETAKKYAQLKELLEKNLRDLRIFKVGKIHLDIYAVGLDAENRLIGIKTKAIET